MHEDSVPEGLRFPALFKGQGVRGHQYHVFDEPRSVLYHLLMRLKANKNLGTSSKGRSLPLHMYLLVYNYANGFWQH